MSKIFFSSFPSNTNQYEIQNFFSQFGKIKSLELSKSKSQGFFKGYGNITFINKEDAQRVLSTQDLKFNSRRVLVGPWKSGKDLIKSRERVMKNRVFLLKIPAKVTDEEILSTFSQHWEMESAFRVVKQGRSLTYGYATFKNLHDKIECLKLGSLKLVKSGKKLKCIDFNHEKKDNKAWNKTQKNQYKNPILKQIHNPTNLLRVLSSTENSNESRKSVIVEEQSKIINQNQLTKNFFKKYKNDKTDNEIPNKLSLSKHQFIKPTSNLYSMIERPTLFHQNQNIRLNKKLTARKSISRLSTGTSL